MDTNTEQGTAHREVLVGLLDASMYTAVFGGSELLLALMKSAAGIYADLHGQSEAYETVKIMAVCTQLAESILACVDFGHFTTTANNQAENLFGLNEMTTKNIPREGDMNTGCIAPIAVEEGALCKPIRGGALSAGSWLRQETWCLLWVIFLTGLLCREAVLVPQVHRAGQWPGRH